MRQKWWTVLFLLISQNSQALVEFKSNFLPSAAVVGRADLVFSSHNTLLFEMGWLSVGGYAAYETISENVSDQSYGGALRFGKETYFEVQAGAFQRNFTQESTELKGKGISGNLI